jgi:DNA-binding LytR/AlgR family response regulator
MKEKINCYIIDDEPLAIEILEEYIRKVPFLELKGSFNSALEASGKMKADKFEVLFLDVNMPDIDGLSFIGMLNPRPVIVLTTAHDAFALKAYELEVADYLLKPISFDRFYRSALRLYNLLKTGVLPDKDMPAETQHDNQYIFVKVGHRIQRIPLSDILFVQGMKDYLQIHTVNEKLMTLTTFAKMEDHLRSNRIVRVHKSYMVAINKIDHIERNRIFIGDQIIPISETYSEGFFKMISEIE